ncbi:Protein RGF1 INDUCIBLE TRANSCRIPTION FACTOR 1 [Linum perenne]
MVRESRLNHNYTSSAGEGSGGGGGDGGVGTEEEEKPAWLEGLIGETFFGNCGAHMDRRKNEKNVYCLICCLSICPHCLPSHPSHPLLQVRRYVYHDVVRLGDLEKLIDCSYIQPYIINSARVIFLNKRPQSRSGGKAAAAANLCFTCDRILQHPFHFCSLSCKVEHMVEEGQDLGSILVVGESEEIAAFSQFEGLRMMDCGDEITYDDGSHMPVPEAAAEVTMTRKKNKNKKQESGLIRAGMNALSLSSRRKGAPQRSPLS